MQKIDLSVTLTNEMLEQAAALAATRAHTEKSAKLDLIGHVGTHIDLMGKEFDLKRTQTTGRIFDVRQVRADEITLKDFACEQVGAGEFPLFLTGRMQECAYGAKEYFLPSKELAWEVIEFLIARQVALIGVDMAGVRKAAEHVKADTLCAERGIFVVENLDQLPAVWEAAGGKPFTVQLYPLRLSGVTGLPCRVVAEM